MRAFIQMMKRHEAALSRFVDSSIAGLKGLMAALREAFEDLMRGMPQGSPVRRAQYVGRAIPRAFRAFQEALPDRLRRAVRGGLALAFRHASELAKFHNSRLVLDAAREAGRRFLRDYPAGVLVDSLVQQVKGQVQSALAVASLQEDILGRMRSSLAAARQSLASRITLLVGAQVNGAYSRGSESVASTQPPEPPEDGKPSRGRRRWVRRIYETVDGRNHPFSRAAHGTTAREGKPFRVSVSAVRDAAAQMKRRGNTGIFWRQAGAFYVGKNLPAHYNERGRVIPWRLDWKWPE